MWFGCRALLFLLNTVSLPMAQPNQTECLLKTRKPSSEASLSRTIYPNLLLLLSSKSCQEPLTPFSVHTKPQKCLPHKIMSSISSLSSHGLCTGAWGTPTTLISCLRSAKGCSCPPKDPVSAKPTQGRENSGRSSVGLSGACRGLSDT